MKIAEDFWYYKEKEAFDYIMKVTEKLLTKKLKFENKDIYSISTSSKHSNVDSKKQSQPKKKK